mgnify:CR=1 FL=1
MADDKNIKTPDIPAADTGPEPDSRRLPKLEPENRSQSAHSRRQTRNRNQKRLPLMYLFITSLKL